MNILLDTHVWIWSMEDKSKIGKKALQLLNNSAHTLYISPISTLEIAQLLIKNRIRFTSSIEHWIDQSITRLKLTTSPITHQVSVEAYRLGESFHGDPADRILVSTAKLMNCPLMTADQTILSFDDVYTIEARK